MRWGGVGWGGTITSLQLRSFLWPTCGHTQHDIVFRCWTFVPGVQKCLSKLARSGMHVSRWHSQDDAPKEKDCCAVPFLVSRGPWFRNHPWFQNHRFWFQNHPWFQNHRFWFQNHPVLVAESSLVSESFRNHPQLSPRGPAGCLQDERREDRFAGGCLSTLRPSSHFAGRCDVAQSEPVAFSADPSLGDGESIRKLQMGIYKWYVYTFIHIHIYIYTHIHTYIHTYIYILWHGNILILGPALWSKTSANPGAAHTVKHSHWESTGGTNTGRSMSWVRPNGWCSSSAVDKGN